MLTRAQFMGKTEKEVNAENRKFVAKVVLVRVVAPIAAIAVAAYLWKRMDDKEFASNCDI